MDELNLICKFLSYCLPKILSNLKYMANAIYDEFSLFAVRSLAAYFLRVLSEMDVAFVVNCS